MAKARREWVSEDFARCLRAMQVQMKKDLDERIRFSNRDKGRKIIGVSRGFGNYLDNLRERLKMDTGKRYSDRELTAFLAVERPVIYLGNKKKIGV